MTLGPNGEVIENGEQGEQSTESAQQQVVEPEGSHDPVDLNEAFKMYREANKTQTSPDVQEPEDEPEGNEDFNERQSESNSVGTEGPDGIGGSSASMPKPDQQTQGNSGQQDLGDGDVDYGAYAKNLVDEINRAAVTKVNKKFEELGIKEVSISQLYEKDERTGRVSFRNPDDPNHPFSSRSEAQAWVNSYNQDVEAERKKAAISERNSLLEQYEPTMQLIAFAPKLKKMSEDERMVMNQIVEPYAIKASNGQITGYRCDLNAAAKRASNMVSSMRSKWNVGQQQQQQQAPKKQAGTTPAVDMKSHGGAGNDLNVEPKNIQEAMMMYNKQKAEARSKKKGKK